MHHRYALCWIPLPMAAAGLLDGGLRAAEVHLLAGLAVSYLGFLWYCGDSDARGYRRTRWLSVGMVAFLAGAVPYYLVRSREDGERAGALVEYAAYLAVVALAVWVGVAVRIGLE